MAHSKAMTIRFTEAQQQMLKEEARRQGMTFTEFVRSAALTVALYERGKRGEVEAEALLNLFEQLREG